MCLYVCACVRACVHACVCFCVCVFCINVSIEMFTLQMLFASFQIDVCRSMEDKYTVEVACEIVKVQKCSFQETF